MDKPDNKQRTPPRFSWKVWAVWVLILAIPYSFFGYEDNIFRFPEEIRLIGSVAFGLIVGTFGAFMYYGTYYVFRKWVFGLVSKQVEQSSLQVDAEQLQNELEANFFTNLVKINFKYLDKYYLQTQVQAEKSFVLSAIAAAVGLAVIIAGIVLMFLGKTNPAYIATGAGVLSEFIAAVFFYLYNKTILKMSDYHQKLVITQNISLALKISESLPKQKQTDAQIDIIHALTDQVNLYLSQNYSESRTVKSKPNVKVNKDASP